VTKSFLRPLNVSKAKFFTKKHLVFHVFFRDFLVSNFAFETLRGRKNDFVTKILLGTCSETSNCPWDSLSWPQNKYSDVHGRKRKKYCEKRPKPPFFGHFWGVLALLFRKTEVLYFYTFLTTSSRGHARKYSVIILLC